MAPENAGDDKTVIFYDANAADFAQTGLPDIDRKHLERLAARLPIGGTLCDFGCGAGHASLAFKEAGFRVTALDGAPGIAQEARRRTGLNVRVQRFDAIEGRGGIRRHVGRPYVAPRAARRSWRRAGPICSGVKTGRGIISLQ